MYSVKKKKKDEKILKRVMHDQDFFKNWIKISYINRFFLGMTQP